MISYAKTLTDSSGCVHSIDNLVVEYLVRSTGQDFVLSSLAHEVFEPVIVGWTLQDNSKSDNSPCSAYNWFRSSIWGGGFYLQFGQYRDFDKLTREWFELPVLRVKFNPNKYSDSPVLARLLDWIKRECDNGVLVKLDYAVDIPARLSDIRVRSRKEPGLFKGTRYYGQRNKHGRLKLYDKKLESALSSDLTRVEWTFCHGKPLSFDDVFWVTRGPKPLPDISELSPQTRTLALLLLEIRSLGGDVASSLGLLDSRTAKKIEPYTLGEGVRLLSDSCLTSFGALVEHYCDVLSVSFASGGVNIGYPLSRFSLDDLEDDSLPF